MQVEIHWLLVTFPDGVQQCAIVDELSNTVQFHHGDSYYFENGAYHVPGWCETLGLKLECGTRTISIP